MFIQAGIISANHRIGFDVRQQMPRAPMATAIHTGKYHITRARFALAVIVLSATVAVALPELIKEWFTSAQAQTTPRSSRDISRCRSTLHF
jgi:hypothetical protein